MRELRDYLQAMKDQKASDLLIITGSPVSCKQGKQVRPVFDDESKVMPDRARELVDEIYRYTKPKRTQDHLHTARDDDFAFGIDDLARFRVNVYYQRGSLAAVIRIVPNLIPDYHKIGIKNYIINSVIESPAPNGDPEDDRLSKLKSGLILITGTAGSGTSTTQACMVDYINRTRSAHVVTLEDPVEYTHRNQMGIVSQREIGIDVMDYPHGLRSCLREAPDVILIGEMRDAETIKAAITAAETGHLVIATLHTESAVSSVNRIIDSFPGSQQDQIRSQLSYVLRTVISQQLVRSSSGGFVPAFEVMHVNTAIGNCIRGNDPNGMDRTINEGQDGMISMDRFLADLEDGSDSVSLSSGGPASNESVSSRLPVPPVEPPVKQSGWPFRKK